MKSIPSIFDTIIVGSGIAGLNFALGAAKHGKVLIITKKRTVESSTNRAQGGIAAVLDQTDNIEKHIRDTLEAGAYHNQRKAVEFMIQKSAEAITRLIELGVPFATNEEGELLLTREGGHSERRIAFVGDYTGQSIEATLIQKVEKNENIAIWEHTFAMDLLVKGKIAYGIRVIQGDKIHHVFGGNIVLATGGIGQVYRYTTNPPISTGDGLAIGIRAGIPTKDLEFIQFHPTALKLGGRTKFLLSEALRGEGAYLINSKGERFMLSRHRLGELAPRDVVARGVYEEDLKGGAFLDIRHENGQKIKLRFPQIYQKLKTYNLDLTRDLIPIAPAAHYICGGLVTNRQGATSIKNVYAFGEVAWTGVHGANRLASNSLLEALVFSSQIIQQTIKNKKVAKLLPSFKKPPYQKSSPALSKKIRALQNELRNSMWKNAGIMRTEKRLKQAENQLEKMNQKLKDLSQKGITISLKETENMILSAQAVVQAALKRKESLGSHFMDPRSCSHKRSL